MYCFLFTTPNSCRLDLVAQRAEMEVNGNDPEVRLKLMEDAEEADLSHWKGSIEKEGDGVKFS